jgi:hypothetical protein
VYSLNPALIEMLAKERAAELARRPVQSLRPGPASRRSGSLRTAAGWAMVEIGLRLAVPRRGTGPECIGPERVGPERVGSERVGSERVAMSGGAGIVAR